MQEVFEKEQDSAPCLTEESAATEEAVRTKHTHTH